ncbi:MAG: integrase arm-type DNA-binding domain-containing protein [Desulfovibrio sp.]|jgi:integrase|nr:integrase arm-type DNA-binding domain-containing protein [Desulfovibrio sp.]
MKLTDAAIRAVKPTEKAQKIFDGGGLYLLVVPTGGKLWRLDYRFAGKRKTLALGSYPAVSLKDARARREKAKEQLAVGIDPGAHKQAVKAAVRSESENSFEVIGREWFGKHSPQWADTHRRHTLAYLEKDIFPLLGGYPVNGITAPQLLNVLRGMESRGAPSAARKMRQTCGQIFRYAVATGRAEHDSSAGLKDALAPRQVRNFPSIKEPAAIGALLRDIEAYNSNTVIRAALRLAPYVFVRPGELRRAEWAEFDLEKAEWRIPAERMKMRVVHIVPLARQVVNILEDLRQYTGGSRFLFPSMRAASAPISDMTLLAGLRRLGYGKDEMTVHGFRSMASTLLNEQGYNRDWIERQLAHGERDAVRAAYNYAQYLSERRRMMQEWADYLDGLRDEKVTVDTFIPDLPHTPVRPPSGRPNLVVRRGGKAK